MGDIKKLYKYLQSRKVQGLGSEEEFKDGFLNDSAFSQRVYDYVKPLFSDIEETHKEFVDGFREPKNNTAYATPVPYEKKKYYDPREDYPDWVDKQKQYFGNPPKDIDEAAVGIKKANNMELTPQEKRQERQAKIAEHIDANAGIEAYNTYKREEAAYRAAITSRLDTDIERAKEAKRAKEEDIKKTIPQGSRALALFPQAKMAVQWTVPAYTLDILEDTKELLEAPTKGSNWAGSIWAGFRDNADMKSFLSLGMSTFAKTGKVYDICKRYTNGEALTDEETNLLEALAMNTAVAGLRAGDVSGWYRSGEITGDMVEIMGQFLLTGGIGTGASKVVSKAIGKTMQKILPKLVSKMGAKGAVGTVLRGAKFAGKGAVDVVAGGAAQSIYMPSTYSGYWEKKSGTVTHGDKDGEYNIEPSKINDLQAMLSSMAETGTERLGGAFVGAGSKILKNIVPKSWAKLSTKGAIGALIKAGGTANKYMAKAGVNSTMGELSEEFAGAAFDKAIGASSDEEWKAFWSKDNMLQMVGGFAPMSILGLGMNGATIANKRLSALRSKRKFVAFTREAGSKEGVKMAEDILNTPIEDLGNKMHKYTQEIGGYTDGELNDKGVEFNYFAAEMLRRSTERNIADEWDSDIRQEAEDNVNTGDKRTIDDTVVDRVDDRVDDTEQTIPQVQQGDEVEYDNARWIVGDVAEEDGEYTFGDESIPLKKGNVLMFEADGNGIRILESTADLYAEDKDNGIESRRQEIYEKYRPVMNVDTGNIIQLSSTADNDNIAYVVKGRVVYDEEGNIDYDKSDDTIYYKVYDKDGNEVDGGTPRPLHLKTHRTEFGKVLSDTPIEEYVDNELYPQDETEQSSATGSVSTDEYQEVTDENGLPFVKTSNGVTDFGYIPEDTGLTPAPIRLSIGDERTGLQHIVDRHGEQIAKAGFDNVVDFVEYVASNYDTITEGVDTSGEPNGTYLLQAKDKHNNTLYVELSNDGSYWNINSGGVFRKGYGEKNKVVWSASEVQRRLKSATPDTLRSQDEADNQGDPNRTVSDTTSTDKGTTNNLNIQNTVLDSEEADLLMSAMEQNAEVMQNLELNYDNWLSEFGRDGIVDTPIGSVKMGDNQFLKMSSKERQGQFGMVRPTLTDPDIIIEEPSEARVGQSTERGSSYLFVKTFDVNGEKIRHFESITVKKDGLEVSVSSHIIKPAQLKSRLLNGSILWSKPQIANSIVSGEQQTLDDSRTQDPNANNHGSEVRVSTDSKGTTNNSNRQEEFYNSLPRNKKGEVDESRMNAEQKIRYAQAEFGQNTDLVRDYIAEQSKALSEKISRLTNKTGKSVAEYKELAALREDKKLEELVTLLKKTGFADVKTGEDFYNALAEIGGSEHYLRPNGTVLGFVKGNTIYLNPDEVSLNTPIHEFGHLWVSQVKGHFPELWAKGKELFLESDYLRKVQADPNYQHLDLDGQIDEAMARAIGDRGEQELDKTLLEKILDWIAEVWEKIGGVFGIDNLTSEQISNLTLQDFTDMATSELLSGQNLTERVNGNRGGTTRYNTADETADIKAKAIADGTFMKAPNGKDTNLTERQWLQVRTKAFKKWFGDWEKTARIEKLKKTKPIEITGDEVKPSDDLKEYKKNALEYGKTLQGEYTNKDTGITIQLQRGRKNGGLNEVLQHDYKDREHLQSIVAIPQIIENATYIDSEPNNDIPKNPDVKEYQYYVCGLKIGGEDYTVRAVVAVDNKGDRYYDHKLTNIEKGKLLDQINSQAIKNNGFGTTPGTKPTTVVSEYKDSKLISLLQENSSKVVDENGEPMVVYHGTNENFNIFDKKKAGSGNDNGLRGKGFYLSPNQKTSEAYGGRVISAYISLKHPFNPSEFASAEEVAKHLTNRLVQQGYDEYTVDSSIFNVGYSFSVGNEYANVFSSILREAGYDGVLYPHRQEVITFDSHQIKSATDNIGTFNEEDEDIRYMLVDVQDEKAIDEERRRPKFEIKGEDVYTTMYTTRADTETEIDVLYNGNDFEKALSKAEGYNEDSDREDLTVGVEAVRLKIPIAAIKEEYDYDDEEYDGYVAPFVEDYIDDFVENTDYDRYETGRDMFDVYKSKLDPDENDLIKAVADELWRQTGFSVGKYSTFYITRNGEMTNTEEGKDGEPNAFVSMRIADHTHSRQNGDSTLNIVVADDDPTKTKFQYSKEDLRYTTKDNAEEIVKDILDFWRQYAREYFGDINKQFNDDLDEFERNRLLSSRKFNLGRPSPILMAAGLNGVSIQMTQSVLSKHLDKHNLKTDDLRELPEAIRTPIMVYEWGDKARNSVIVTSIPRGEERITTTIRLTRDGNKLNVNEISSIYGKSAERLIRDINTPKSEFGKDNLRYVDKKQVLDWFAMEAPKASSQTQQELITATKVIENFENPPINEKKVIDDTTNDMVRYSIKASEQLDKEDEVMGERAAEIYEARVKMGKQMNQSNPNLMPNKKIFDEINEKTENRRAKTAEHAADCYLPMKHLIEIFNKHGYNIADYNNWYMNVFALAGKNEAEYEKYQAERSKPLQRAAKAAMDSGQISYRELENYLILKHGQERNKYYKERDEKLGVKPMKDYSGTEAVMFEEFCKRTGIKVKTIEEDIPTLVDGDPNMIRYDNGKSEFSKDGKKIPDFEVNKRFELWRKQHTPEEIIKDYEEKIGKEKVEDLWSKIRKATQFTLDCQKEGGLTSEEMYQKASGMWEYFVPLRGFDMGTAQDEYDYDLNGITLFTDFRVEQTLGRTRRSVSPLAWTEQMAHITIQQKNKNLLNQSLRRLASVSMARKDNIMFLSKQYKAPDVIENGKVVREGALINPPAHTGNPTEDSAAFERWETSMKEGVKNGTVEVVEHSNVNFGMIVSADKVKQHVVRVYEGGRPVDIIFNTSPSVPRAINGLNNKTVVLNDWFSRQVKAGTRLIAQTMTTYNPAFVGKNFMRDYLFANTMLMGKEDRTYRANFNKNIVKAHSVMFDYVKGKSLLGWAAGDKGSVRDNEYGRLLTEFVMNGGKTGFSQMFKFEKMSSDFKKQTERGDKTIHYGINDYIHFIEAMNDYAENITRFAAYCASRQAGRSIERSISDAKELTINFNRKGIDGGVWGEIRSLCAFSNASIQALVVFSRGVRANPKRLSAIISSYVAMPIAMAIVASLVGGDDYFKLSKYDRQNNICIPMFGGGFIKIPLPQELRVFWKLGDEIALCIYRNEPPEVAAQEVFMGALDLLPSFAAGATSISDVLDEKIGAGELLLAHQPITILQPITQVMANRNFLNYRIYDDNKWGGRRKELPEYRKALRNKGGETYSPNFAVKLSEGISRLTGGSDLKRGVVEVNPDIMNHFMRGYFGGLYNTAVAAINMGDKGAQSIAAGEWRLKSTDSPTMKAFYVSPSNLRYTDDILNAQYMDVLKEAKKHADVYANYLKEGEVDRFEEETKMTEDEALDWRYLVKGIDKEVQELRNEIATAETTKERDEALRQLEALQREAIDMAVKLKK